MKLQTASRIAIFAVLELARDPQRQLSAGEIGEMYDVSVHHLAKVLNVLVRAGLIRSVRGAGGGYMFTGNVKRTTLYDIVRLFEPAEFSDDSGGARGRSTPAGQALQLLLDEIDDIARATLNSVTLATMLKLTDEQRAGPKLEQVPA